MANIKLTNDNWETSGVYDLTEQKTQRVINSELRGALDNKAAYRAFTNMDANTVSDLLSCLNANNSSIPTGSSILKLGNSSNGARCTLVCNKINANIATAYSVSPYTSIDGINLSCSNGTWTVKSSKYPRLNGKRIYIYGDSMSDETSQTVSSLQPNWVALMRDILPLSTITNQSVAGYPITGSSLSICSKVNAETAINADIIILFGGTNDFRHSAELGVFGATTPSNSTFCGSLEIIRNKFVSLAPNAEVYVVTPPKLNDTNLPSDNNSACPVIVYRNALATFAGMNGYSLIDGYSFPLLNPYNSTMKTTYQSDGIHQLSAYAPILANYILSKIDSGGDTSLMPEMVRVDISKYAATGTNFTATGHFAYADFDSCGKTTLTMAGHFTATEGTAYTIMTLPQYLRPLTSGIVVMQAQIGSNFYAEYCTINASGTIITKRPPASGTEYFSIMVEYNTKFNGYNSNPA